MSVEPPGLLATIVRVAFSRRLFIFFMISPEECKKYLGDENISDEEAEEILGSLYAFVEKVLID